MKPVVDDGTIKYGSESSSTHIYYMPETKRSCVEKKKLLLLFLSLTFVTVFIVLLCLIGIAFVERDGEQGKVQIVEQVVIHETSEVLPNRERLVLPDLAGVNEVSTGSPLVFRKNTEPSTGRTIATSKISDKRRRLPKAIIAGVKKGGTRALLAYLRLHPQVRSVGPEPHFFDRHYARGVEWYRNQMPLSAANQITIEKTPSYFVTKNVPERIFKLNPQMKILIVLRDPVTRAISDFTQSAAKGRTSQSFEESALRLPNAKFLERMSNDSVNAIYRNRKLIASGMESSWECTPSICLSGYSGFLEINCI